MKESGQIVIILLLVMVISLAIGLSVAGRSINEISTSTNTENSSRAFSAAEAGIERILQQSSITELGERPLTLPSIDLENNAQAKDVILDADIPKAQTALEYPPFGKESFAQFWLIDPDLDCGNEKSRCYTQDNFDIFFGTAKDYSAGLADQPAIEANVIVKAAGGEYFSKRYFIDSHSGRVDSNGFLQCARRATGPEYNDLKLKTNDSPSERSLFYCKANISGYKDGAGDTPYMVRVRILYSNSSHPVAINPASGFSLPLQTNIYKSTGVSGDVQRTLNVFREKSVMPQFFDYALFSASDMNK